MNGTILYDLDAKTKTVIENFSSEMSLVGKYVRVAARYQENGTLVAVRIWASTKFNTVWVSPEGHLLHVDAGTDVVWIENESGRGIPLTVNAGTQFFFRDPHNGAADSKSIGMGPGFLSEQGSCARLQGACEHRRSAGHSARGPEHRHRDGAVRRRDLYAQHGCIHYTHNFLDRSDDYVYTMDYISGQTANGTDDAGNAITGYKWWNFAYPTLLDERRQRDRRLHLGDRGSVNFGGTVGTVPSYGVSYAVWNDPADANGWAAYATVLLPSALPLGTVAAGLVNDAFSMTVVGGPPRPRWM